MISPILRREETNRKVKHPDLKPFLSLLRKNGNNHTQGISRKRKRVLVKSLLRQRKPDKSTQKEKVPVQKATKISKTRERKLNSIKTDGKAKYFTRGSKRKNGRNHKKS